MWRTLGGGSVAGKTRFSVELARVLADEADGDTVFVALAAVRDAGSRGARARGSRGCCLARRRPSNTEACIPRDLKPHVPEGGTTLTYVPAIIGELVQGAQR